MRSEEGERARGIKGGEQPQVDHDLPTAVLRRRAREPARPGRLTAGIQEERGRLIEIFESASQLNGR